MKSKNLDHERLAEGDESNALAFMWGYLIGLEIMDNITPQNITRLRNKVVQNFPKLFKDDE